MEKAHAEYRKYQVNTVSPVEKVFLESIAELEQVVKRRGEQ